MASYLFRCILLKLSFGAVLTGTVMFALSGMCFPLFPNLTFHEFVTLFREDNKESAWIASWEVKNATFTLRGLNPNYTGKVFMSMNETPVIWTCNLDQTHSSKYIVQYGIKTAALEVELTVMENKQLDVCLNSTPNSPEKCFGNLTEEQVVQYIEKFLDDHPQYIKRHFGKLTEDEFEKWLDDHPGFMKKYFGHLTVEQIKQEIRKLQDDQTEHIKEYLDGWNPLFLGQLIVTCIIGMMTLLCILANRNQIREGLINMKDWIQKKLCSQPMSENGSRTQAKSIVMEESVEPDLQLQAQHDTCPISTMTVTDQTNSKVQRPFKNIERLLPRNNDTVFTDTQSSTSNVEQNTNIKSKKRPEDLDSDSDSNDEQDKLLKDSVDPDM